MEVIPLGRPSVYPWKKQMDEEFWNLPTPLELSPMPHLQ